MAYFHQPVLLNEVLDYLNPLPNQNFIDGTVGGGGHAGAILEKIKPAGILIGLDRDPLAIKAASENLKKFKERVILVQENYSNLTEVIQKNKNTNHDTANNLQFSGILLDLGLSSAQVSETDLRGFSFKGAQTLDMRFGPQTELTAEEIINDWPAEKLIQIFKEYGEETRAKLIVQKIINYRIQKRIKLTDQLVGIINQAIGFGRGKINPATKVFQALRIAVNDELENLQQTLPKLLEILPTGGRLVIISFHSLEDRIVKNFFQAQARGCICPKILPVCCCNHTPAIKILTRKSVTASPEELQKNPRARSAKLRAVEKL
ncbi:MAG: 16S rRNA (cytosine(1402)-N(4))-methyltransferase RsmH [Patescibacteria group bacterium]|jgi:16S rRNA (cytosine1402-N4)-methyltransferase